MQTLQEKCEALKSLLPAMWVYLSLHERALKLTRYQTPTVDPGDPPPVWLGLDCNGVCIWCEWEDECKGDGWEFVNDLLTRRYHMGTVSGTFVRLQNAAPQLAHAVRATYIEPYDPHCNRDHEIMHEVGSEPVGRGDRRERQRWADAGVRWMGRKISFDLTPLWEKPKTLREKVEELVIQGARTSDIAYRLGCTDRRVRQIKAALEVRQESTVVRL